MSSIFSFPISNAQIAGFDDFQVRQQSRLQQQWGQVLPLTLDGGRQALWWCPSCRRVWHERGRHVPFRYVSSAQARSLASALCFSGEMGLHFPKTCCPGCTGTSLGGIPRTLELQDRTGYRLTWERTTSPALFLCLVSALPFREDADVLQEVLSIPADLPLAPFAQLRQLLHWLRDIPDPTWDVVMPLSADHCTILAKQYAAFPGLWHGYAWICRDSSLGPVLLVFGGMLPLDAVSSVEILLSCWRMIALEMAYML